MQILTDEVTHYQKTRLALGFLLRINLTMFFSKQYILEIRGQKLINRRIAIFVTYLEKDLGYFPENVYLQNNHLIQLLINAFAS
jgi:hypothetical protein